MKRKLLKLPFLALSELSPGIKFTAVVSHLSKTGIVVRVEDRFTGLIPYLHASDTPVKRPAERFQSGQTIDCLVLSVDQENNKLLLTAKYSLLNANYPLLGSTEMYSIVAEGKTKNQLFVAFVVDITEQGILVAGLNELRAWLPRRETGLNPDDVLEVSYFRGQVLRVRIIRSLSNKPQSADERRSQFLVSLKANTDDAPPRKRRAKGSHFHIGQVRAQFPFTCLSLSLFVGRSLLY
ncbi:unnamed protein product [Dicrocoelium dendriticum]|nr:unnamed protein product [Dicrocoelium dendriticum]